MKKISLIIYLVLIGNFTFSQGNKISEPDVPSNIRSNFNYLYPDTKVDKWRKNNGNYEAIFDRYKIDMTAIFDVNGKFIQTIENSKYSSLPKYIIDFLASNYPKQKLKEVSKIITYNGQMTYEIEIKDTHLIFDLYGSFINSKVIIQ